MIRLVWLCVILNVFVGCLNNNDDGITPQAQDFLFDKEKSLAENVDNYINTLIGENSPGIAIAIVNNGEEVLKKGYGLANLDKQTPMSTTTPVYLASVSKQFYAMGILILQEQEVLNVEDKINTYFPEFPDGWSEVSIHHLLTHQSGIPDYFGKISEDKMLDITNDKVLEWAVEQELDFTPGRIFKYSNTGYIILSELIKRVSQQPIEDFMKEQIFGPVGMNKTLVYDESKPEITDRAIGYFPNGELLDYSILTTGGGGIFSTIDDLLLWSKALDEYTLVEESTFKLATTPYLNNYGYGWFIGSINHKAHINHSGGLSGFRTNILKYSTTGLTIVMLSNGSPDWTFDLTTKILNYLFP